MMDEGLFGGFSESLLYMGIVYGLNQGLLCYIGKGGLYRILHDILFLNNNYIFDMVIIRCGYLFSVSDIFRASVFAARHRSASWDRGVGSNQTHRVQKRLRDLGQIHKIGGTN